MNKKFYKGDVVVILGKVEHVRQSGTLDILIGKDKVAFNVAPSQVGLVVDPDTEEKDEDYDPIFPD